MSNGENNPPPGEGQNLRPGSTQLPGLTPKTYIDHAEDIGALVFKGALGAIIIGFLVILVMNLNDGKILTLLSEPAVVRGFITFIIALATIAIAIILVVAAFTYSSKASQDDATKDIKERFGMGKEVLTALIGILGTIVGFYFGQGLTTPGGLTISAVSATNYAPKPGDTFQLNFKVTGGNPLFIYTITFPTDTVNEIHGDSAKGDISVDVKVPVKMTPGRPLTLTPIIIEVKDNSGKSQKLEWKEKTIQVKEKPPDEPKK